MKVSYLVALNLVVVYSVVLLTVLGVGTKRRELVKYNILSQLYICVGDSISNCLYLQPSNTISLIVSIISVYPMHQLSILEECILRQKYLCHKYHQEMIHETGYVKMLTIY